MVGWLILWLGVANFSLVGNFGYECSRSNLDIGMWLILFVSIWVSICGCSNLGVVMWLF